MKSLDVRIFVWAMRRDHIGRHPHTPEKAHQRGGEIAATRAAHKAWVIVKGEHPGQAMLAQKLGYHLEEGLGIEIATHLAVQPDRGASINKVGNLDHMQLFALGISRDTTGIFQIELDFLARLPEF